MNAIKQTESSDRVFFGIVSYSSALAFGAVLASLEALRNNPWGFDFHFSIWTLVAGLLGATAALGYWKIVSLDTMAKSHSLLRAASIFMGLGGVAAFLYPLRFVPKDASMEVGEGLGAAVLVLSTVGYMLRRIMRFLDQDAARTMESQ